jgi:fibronectin type 3 domain-containing protein
VTASGKANLTWKGGKDVKEYRVVRGAADEAWKVRYDQIGVVQAPAFEDKELTPGKTYFYRVTALAADGTPSPPSVQARTQPRVLIQPVVSVADKQVEVSWNRHPAEDVAGYNVYRGLVNVRTVQKGTPAAWKDNDPEYAEPMPVEVRDITEIRKLNDRPLTATRWTDPLVLKKASPGEGEYRFNVYAYIVKAVNKLGTESGPSPYALTLPAEPVNVLCREAGGGVAELKWEPSPEKGIAGYRIYKLQGTWSIVRVTAEPIKETTFSEKASGQTRYWVVAVDSQGQEGQPSSPVWYGRSYKGFFQGDWHQ